MLRRPLFYTLLLIFSISSMVGCTAESGSTPVDEAETSDLSDGSDPTEAATTTEPSDESELSDAADASDDADLSDQSNPTDVLEPGPCDASLRIVCGQEIQIDSSEGQAAIENHPACDDTFRFPGKELRYFFESTFSGRVTLDFQRDGGLTTTFMTFVYETAPSTCDLGNGCHAQGDDYQQPLEFGVRDGYAYHIIWDPRLFEDTATGR